MPDIRVAVIIPAAGASTRFAEPGVERSKLDEDLGGRPLVQRTVELFTKNPAINEAVETIIVAGPHDEQTFADFKLRHTDRMALLGASICRGGETHRWQTVRAALEHVPESATHVAIHDAARPCTPEHLIERLFRLAATCQAIVPGLAVSDTIKRAGEPRELEGTADHVAAILGAESADEVRDVIETLDRRGLFATQTPQIFEVGLLRRAYEGVENINASEITDDAALVERLGESVMLIDGDAANIKITRAADIAIARALLGLRPPSDRATHKRF